MNEFDTSDMRLERDLRSVLAERARRPVPASLYQAAGSVPMTTRPQRRFISSFAVGAVGLGMVLVISMALVVSYLGRPVGPGSGPRAFDWQTQVASLEADSVSIHAGEAVFSPPADAVAHSDPGSPNYRTLEMTWSEQGVEMRLNVYFAADERDWWVTEIRTYDGASPSNWIYYQAPAIKAARGSSYTGSVDLIGSRGSVPGRLTIDALRLTAFAPGTGVTWQPGCHPAGPVATSGNEPVAQPVGGPDLDAYGISRGTPAGAADRALTTAGICHEFRLGYSMDSSGLGYAQVWCTPPDGDVADWLLGPDGQLILFIDAAANETLPPNAQELVNCSSGSSRSSSGNRGLAAGANQSAGPHDRWLTGPGVRFQTLGE